MVDWGRRTSWRRAAAPTSTPSRANDTIDGRSCCPSRSGMTTGRPVLSSTYATRLLVVPRSMPTMRSTMSVAYSVLLAFEGSREIVDHCAEVGPCRQRVLERGEGGRLAGDGGGVPGLAQRPGDLRLGLGHTGFEPRALLGQRGARGVVEGAGLGLLECLLELEHLAEQRRRSLGLDGRAFLRFPALFQADEVLHAGERVAQRAVGRVYT